MKYITACKSFIVVLVLVISCKNEDSKKNGSADDETDKSTESETDEKDTENGSDADTDTDSDSDSDTDGDTDTDSDTDGDTDTDTDTDSESGSDVDTDTEVVFVIEHQPMTDCEGGKYDPDTKFCWQDPPVEVKRADAIEYCENLEMGGYDNWRLPSLSEVRTLVRAGDKKDCRKLEWDLSWEKPPENYCNIYDGCLNWDDCWVDSCYSDAHGGPGERGLFMDPALTKGDVTYSSISTISVYPHKPNATWGINFLACSVNSGNSEDAIVRCMRKGP